MHDLVEDLVVPDAVPEAAATVLRTARELLRQSYYCYEFSTVAVMHSLIAVEIVLRDRIPGAGNKTLQKLIKQRAETGVLTARQAEYPRLRPPDPQRHGARQDHPRGDAASHGCADGDDLVHDRLRGLRSTHHMITAR
ncbi:hypothetical protein ABT083_29840 [Streptomyces goshikiensis]|uniref:hypothetical protein n=1 Tax=Streptomyces goshikiensis TaxID=1942 RepID=UPI00331FD31D